MGLRIALQKPCCSTRLTAAAVEEEDLEDEEGFDEEERLVDVDFFEEEEAFADEDDCEATLSADLNVDENEATCGGAVLSEPEELLFAVGIRLASPSSTPRRAAASVWTLLFHLRKGSFLSKSLSDGCEPSIGLLGPVDLLGDREPSSPSSSSES